MTVTLKRLVGVADGRPCARGENEAERVLGHRLGLVSVAAFSALRVALALGLAQALVIVKKWGKRPTFRTSFRRRINDKDVWLRRSPRFIPNLPSSARPADTRFRPAYRSSITLQYSCSSHSHTHIFPAFFQLSPVDTLPHASHVQASCAT